MIKNEQQEEYIEQALEFYDNEDYLNALVYFTKAIAEGKIHNEHIYHYRAEAWSKRGEYDIAIMEINDALRENPQNAKLYGKRGEFHHKSAQYSKSIRDLTLAIELESHVPIYYYERSIAHSKISNWTAALEDIETAIHLAGNDAEKESPEFYVQRAEIALKTNDLEKGLEDCQRILKSDSPPNNAYRICGEILLAMGDSINGVKMLEKAAELGENINLSMAKGRHQKHEYQEAIQWCDRYIEFNSTDHEAFHLRGNSYYFLYLKDNDKKNLENARRDCEFALEYYPYFIEAYRTLVRVFLALGDFLRSQHCEEKIKELENLKRT
ncbi:MAG: hypothetical protein LBQ50_10895 [Planctomycetaceae bacterium]|nr:hypothetical protein [Planctomycetaceae bacterium]